MPSSILLESTEQVYRGTVNRSSNIIYHSFCLLFCLLIICSYFLLVPISVTSSAVIRPVSEISQIHSLTNGRIKEAYVRENQIVKKGEILYLIGSDVHEEREKLLSQKKQDIILHINDLVTLLSGSAGNNLKSPLYNQASNNYYQKMTEAVIRQNKIQVDFNRNKKLHQEKVIADAEFENYQFELDKANNDVKLIKETQLSTWQNELRDYKRELQEIEGQLAQLYKENENLIVKAPVSGTIQNLAGIYPGSMVFSNQNLAQISPDTSLIIEAYVSPTNIGLIRIKMPVRFQVTAFNYNQWGMATGEVLEISSDVQVINDQPIFKVRCVLDQTYLQLKNGYKGYLKKGMTLQARFMVTKRTLWQLLYDKVDDWLNPNAFPE